MLMLEKEMLGDRLRRLRKEKKLAQTEVAQQLNFDQGTLSNYETNKIVPPTAVIVLLARFYGVSESYLLHGGPKDARDAPKQMDVPSKEVRPTVSFEQLFRQPLGSLFPVKPIPVLGTVRAGRPIMAFEDHEVEEYLWVPKKNPANFGLRVQGDSMIDADIYPGDLVICRACMADYPARVNDVVIALLNDEATLKYLRRDTQDAWFLQAANAQYADIPLSESCDPRILGVVLSVQHPPRHNSPSLADEGHRLQIDDLNAEQQELIRSIIQTQRAINQRKIEPSK